MVIFNSYVKLPEGNPSLTNCNNHDSIHPIPRTVHLLWDWTVWTRLWLPWRQLPRPLCLCRDASSRICRVKGEDRSMGNVGFTQGHTPKHFGGSVSPMKMVKLGIVYLWHWVCHSSSMGAFWILQGKSNMATRKTHGVNRKHIWSLDAFRLSVGGDTLFKPPFTLATICMSGKLVRSSSSSLEHIGLLNVGLFAFRMWAS